MIKRYLRIIIPREGILHVGKATSLSLDVISSVATKGHVCVCFWFNPKGLPDTPLYFNSLVYIHQSALFLGRPLLLDAFFLMVCALAAD